MFMRVLRQEEIYDCLDDDEAFSQLPELVARIVDARSAVFHWRNVDNSAEVLAQSNYWSADDMARYADHFSMHDIWAQSTLLPHTRNKLWILDELVPAPTYQRSTFYNEWIRKLGDDTFHCIGLSIAGKAGTGLIGIHRGRGQGAFQSEHLKILQRHIPHVRRLMRVRGMLSGARRERRPRDGLLDAIATAMISVTRDGKIVYANEAAERLISASGPFHLVGGRIAPRDGMQARNLAAAIAAAACPHSPNAGFVELSSIDGRRTIVAIAPLVETAGRTALLLCQPGVSDGLRFGLRKLFCLTAAEADVAALLAEGLDLAQISKSRRVSLATIRTQVKAVASKMGCQRQAEVVAVVKGVPALPNDAFEADPEFVQA